ncbi:MAG: DEAD/DEAH box helicase [Acidimicrobiales bacterium]
MSPSFSDLGVAAPLVDALRRDGVTVPFPVQALTLPDALAGRDVCGKAPTGSGKTLAFGLPLVALATGSAPRRPRGLVLVPTRELATQVREQLARLSPDRGARVLAIYGGTGYGPALRALSKGVDVVVACPGRLEDLLAQGSLSLGDVRLTVLDEADRMADMGFLPAVRRILDATAERRQVLLFSATFGPEVETLVRRYQHDPVRHEVAATEESVGEVTHHFWQADREDRVALTAKLVAEHGRALVFCRTKHGADRLARQLGRHGLRAVAIHGDRSQGQRERALADFARGSAEALVATDVAARGIHIDDMPCVVHFDPPADATAYVHRSGRTGRAGSDGRVVSLVVPEHRAAVADLQRALGLDRRLDPPGSAAPSAGDSNTTSRPSPGEMPATGTEGATRRTRRIAVGERASGARRRRRRGESRGTMPVGTVKFFNNEKGYGFLSRPDGEDVFVHYSNLEGSGFRTLEAGQQVEFEIGQGRKGDEARNVRVI